MKKCISRKVAAIAASAILVVSIAPFSVMADENPQNVTITKKIVKPANVYAPKTDFSFEIKPGEAKEGTGDSAAIKAGIVDGVTFADNDIKSAPADGDIGQETLTLDDKASLTVNIGKFTQPGIYRYIVSEKAGTYNGMAYDKSEKYFDVYIKKEGTQLQAYSYAFVKKDSPKTKDDGVFTNHYGKPDEPGSDPDAWVNEVKVSKAVAGILGDKDKEFEFDITVTGQEGENFNLVKSDGTKVKLVTGIKQVVKLKHDQNFVITGLSKDDKYEVSEHDYTAEGYKVSNTGDLTKTMGAKGNLAVAFTNTADTNAPTGIIMAYGPYVLLIAATGVLFAVYARKRHAQEEE